MAHKPKKEPLDGPAADLTDEGLEVGADPLASPLIPRIRKALIAALAAIITICHAFGVPVVDGLDLKIIAAFDALVPFAVWWFPNEP